MAAKAKPINKPQKSEAKITKDMTFAQVFEKYPQVGEVIFGSGLHCLGCSGAAFESIEVGCKMHGFDDAKIKKLVEDMNKKINEAKK